MATSNGKGQKSFFKVSLVVWNITLLIQWFPNFEILSKYRGSFWKKIEKSWKLGTLLGTPENLYLGIREIETSCNINSNEKISSDYEFSIWSFKIIDCARPAPRTSSVRIAYNFGLFLSGP